MDLQLNGARVLVTGGSRGIGRAIVEAFLDEGATVGFCARNAEEVEATQQALQGRGTVVGSAVDVGDADALAAWVAESAEAFGGLDVVVSNAAGYAAGELVDLSAADWEALRRTNVDGLFHLAQAEIGRASCRERV